MGLQGAPNPQLGLGPGPSQVRTLPKATCGAEAPPQVLNAPNPPLLPPGTLCR